MRVLAVTTEWPSERHPGSGTFVRSQIEAVRAAGVAVDVDPFRGEKNPANYLLARRRVHRRIAEGAYEIVHAHFGQAGLVVPRGLPMVVTFYGTDLEGFVGPGGSYTLSGSLLTRLSRSVARRADEVIVVSLSLARRLPRGVGYTVIPTAVDLNVFRPTPKEEARRSLGLPLERKIVLFAGRPDVPVKRYELARRVVDDVASENGVDLLTISGRPPAEVARFMNASDALLLTSRHEGAPTMVKEAVACGLPVVSTDVGDVRETIGSIPGCVVVGEHGVAPLASALRGVLWGAGRLDGTTPEGLDRTVQARRVIEVYERAARGVS